MDPAAQNIEFDVAVTVTSTTEAQGGAKLAIAGLSLSGEGGKTLANQAVSRIKFSVPDYIALDGKYLITQCAFACGW